MHHGLSKIAIFALFVSHAPNALSAPLECMERFKFEDFVIGAWWGPDPSESNYKAYVDAGFNVLMTYRNRANAKYGEDYQNPDLEFELAEKLNIPMMLDTYMKNETPWGGIAPDPPSEHPTHHPARLTQLQWLLKRYGKSPVLVGILLGDNCGLHDYMAKNAAYMEEHASGLFPWMSTNPSVDSQAKVPMPLLTTQNYPFLYQVDQPEFVKRKAYCDRLEQDRQCAEKFNMALWPFLNCTDRVSPSQLRFQAYACVAYGAQGIWYFHYNANVWDPKTERPGILYETAKESNQHISAMGRRLVGRRCVGVFHEKDKEEARNALKPDQEALLAELSEGIMAGVLVPEERLKAKDPEAESIVVVDKRTVKPGEDEPPIRKVFVSLPRKRAVTVLTEKGQRKEKTKRVELMLKAGGGALLSFR